MVEIRELFVSYTHVDEFPPAIKLLEDKGAIELIRYSATMWNRVVSTLYNDSTYEDDPILTIVCLTDDRLKKGEPESISQDVINWLMDKGYMVKR